MNIVTVHSRKGGVGKSTIALSSGLQLAARGKRVALVEMDTQGCGLNQYLRLAGEWKADGSDLSDSYALRQRVNDFLITDNTRFGDVLTPLLSKHKQIKDLEGRLLIGPLS